MGLVVVAASSLVSRFPPLAILRSTTLLLFLVQHGGRSPQLRHFTVDPRRARHHTFSKRDR